MFDVSSLTSSQFSNPIFTQSFLPNSSSSTLSLGSGLSFSSSAVNVDLRFLHEAMGIQQDLLQKNEGLNEERSRSFALNNFSEELSSLQEGLDLYAEGGLSVDEEAELLRKQVDLIDDLGDLQRNSQFNGRALLDDPSLRSLTSQLRNLDSTADGFLSEMTDLMTGSGDLVDGLIERSEETIETKEFEISLTESLQSTYLNLSEQFSSPSLANLFDTNLINSQPTFAFGVQANQLNSLVTNQLLLQF